MDNNVRNILCLTGLYMLRRLTAARATQKHSRASHFVCFCSATVFCLRETACAVSLSQTKNRQLQPKRYATGRLKFIGKYME